MTFDIEFEQIKINSELWDIEKLSVILLLDFRSWFQICCGKQIKVKLFPFKVGVGFKFTQTKQIWCIQKHNFRASSFYSHFR